MQRYLIGNLFDFNEEVLTSVAYTDLLPQDKYMLHELYQYGSKVSLYGSKYILWEIVKY